MKSKLNSQNHESDLDESGIAMTEYAIVFMAMAAVLVIALNITDYKDKDNLLYGVAGYFERISHFLALPIP
ncbi:MAG: hypothetical protein HQL32_12665 [Planctomycetes bacterium]|nr:hypothetical protein [Planctomycetota bacterium]